MTRAQIVQIKQEDKKQLCITCRTSVVTNYISLQQIESTTTSEQKCQKCHRDEDTNREQTSTSTPSTMNKMSQQR